MRLVRSVLTLPVWLVVTALAAEAQHSRTHRWPEKPLKAIVTVAPGSATDIVPRIVFEQLSAQLGQPIIVENRPGAGGTIAAASVAMAEADGYTLLVNSSAHTIAPALYPSLSYSVQRDFAAVIPLGVIPNVLVVPPARGFKTLADFVSKAKAKPGAFNFASAGVGTATYLSALRFESAADVRAAHVPFKGGPEAITEVITGRVEFFFAPVGVALPYIRDGKLTALAVNSAKRSAVLPEVPTIFEAGIKNAEYPFWIGAFLPAKTPREVVDRLHQEILKALQEQKVGEKLAALGVEPMTMTPRDFDAFVSREVGDDAALVQAAGLKPPQ